MIDRKHLAELLRRFKPHGSCSRNPAECGCHVASYRQLEDLLDKLLTVKEAAEKLVVHCNHKPEGWDTLDKALAAVKEGA